jgi:hypothetical protein
MNRFTLEYKANDRIAELRHEVTPHGHSSWSWAKQLNLCSNFEENA